MNISLTPELEKFVNDKVKSGRYHSASEVIREGLRLLQEHEQIREVKLAVLREEIHKGWASGQAISGETVFQERRKKADKVTLKETAKRFDRLLEESGVTEEELVADFQAWRATRRPGIGKRHHSQVS